MAINSRAKGIRNELRIAKRFAFAMDQEVSRGLQQQTGAKCSDVVDAGRVTCGPWWPEAKAGKRPSIRAALHQATRDAMGRAIPVALCKDDGQPGIVSMWEDDFFHLVEVERLFAGGPLPEHYPVDCPMRTEVDDE